MELRFARAARTSKDFDLGLRGNRAERIRRLSEVVQLGFDGFTFRLKPEQHEMDLAGRAQPHPLSCPITRAHRCRATSERGQT
jgi:hypothetical protein